MKANYYLAQAHIELHNYEEALTTGLRAHALCVKQNDKSLPQVTALVLRCKQERWQDRERRRKRENQGLENEVLALMQQEMQEALATCESDGLRAEVLKEWEEKAQDLRRTFDLARQNADRDRVVPDWMIDEITFNIFVDPVTVSTSNTPPRSCAPKQIADYLLQTKTGKSYERAAILEHLRRSPTDPLTREPLLPSDLRPNLALKQACEEYLNENGWAVDW
jgi:STIP1 homology and U-box containing protein 1